MEVGRVLPEINLYCIRFMSICFKAKVYLICTHQSGQNKITCIVCLELSPTLLKYPPDKILQAKNKELRLAIVPDIP